MDRNTFTGLFLIMIVLAGSFYFFGPSQTEINKEKERIAADSLKKVAAATKTTAPAIAAAKPAVDSATLSGPFGGSIAGTVQTTVLENENLKLTLTNKGGKILICRGKRPENL
jgi:YidC/Oxa1 family membrane protein insertase